MFSRNEFIRFLKKYSTINNNFIDDFFSLYNIYNKNEFIINLDKVSKWLKSRKGNLKDTLINSYKLNTDYIINQLKANKVGAPKEEILLTVKCFKMLCMNSKTEKSNEVREYFYKLEEFIDKYKNYIIEGLNDKIKKLENNQKPKVNPSKGIIYIIQTADDKTLYKIGKTHNLKKRLNSYNSDKKDDITPLFIYESDNIDAVEKCVKAFIKQYQYRKYKEVYEVNIDIIKAFINECSNIAEKNIENSFKGGEMNNSKYFILLYKNK